MTDKQRIENLKGQVEHLTAENEKLKTINIKELAEDLRNAKNEYMDLINELVDKKMEYDELLFELRTMKATYRQQMDELCGKLV